MHWVGRAVYFSRTYSIRLTPNYAIVSRCKRQRLERTVCVWTLNQCTPSAILKGPCLKKVMVVRIMMRGWGSSRADRSRSMDGPSGWFGSRGAPQLRPDRVRPSSLRALATRQRHHGWRWGSTSGLLLAIGDRAPIDMRAGWVRDARKYPARCSVRGLSVNVREERPVEGRISEHSVQDRPNPPEFYPSS
ncbi:hypothetical protein LMG3431_02529 [Achromobacter pestifer]|uniref:Uncharacterized protein n=1 Tax=Achromobacter pestifer TaxID=1353889 RepID=A0A6S6YXQ8_9BURK|nr:hypothetical protein LMG3431_02529 [Achromobacter pestifer]